MRDLASRVLDATVRLEGPGCSQVRPERLRSVAEWPAFRPVGRATEGPTAVMRLECSLRSNRALEHVGFRPFVRSGSSALPWSAETLAWTADFSPTDLRFVVWPTEAGVYGRAGVLDNLLFLVAVVRLAKLGGVALHASASIAGERAWVTAGPAQVGKSTVARWFESEDRLADDRALLVPDERGGWLAVPSPFAGKAEFEVAERAVPVAGVFVLQRRGRVEVERLRPREAFAALFPHVISPRVPWEPASPLEATARLVEQVPVCVLSVLPGVDPRPAMREVVSGC